MGIKTLTATPDVLEVISKATVEEVDDKFHLKLQGELDRSLYLAVNKHLKALGGAWKGGKVSAHIFEEDPRPMLEGLVQNGEMKVDNEDYFPTPESVVQQMVALAGMRNCSFLTATEILEPSAGEGAICDALVRMGYAHKSRISVYELNDKRRARLQDKGYHVEGADFFDCKKRYACILMNPPFTNSADVDHVLHAWNLLKPNGFLVSVMANGQTWTSDRQKLAAFRALVSEYGYIMTLPKGAFKESGTAIDTVLVFLKKPNGKTVSESQALDVVS